MTYTAPAERSGLFAFGMRPRDARRRTRSTVATHLKPTPIRIPSRSIVVAERGSVSMAINRQLPESVEDLWVVIAMDQGWPVREMAGMGLTELMAWVERAAAMLKAGGWR